MVVVLATRLKIDGKIVEEGTPLSKLTKKERELAKELNLLVQEVEPVPDLEEEIAAEEADEDEEDTAEDSEGESE
jgi:hypothetical protein